MSQRGLAVLMSHTTRKAFSEFLSASVHVLPMNAMGLGVRLHSLKDKRKEEEPDWQDPTAVVLMSGYVSPGVFFFLFSVKSAPSLLCPELCELSSFPNS